ncbi:MAG: decaprenyl-phosphate phosphoribosyltransferase [bacterium]|nr:decaprenyl-phosphate phosphoribosyltransferase [bacterium]
MLRLLRPKQWTKNLLIFAAPLFAERLFDPADFVTACLAFVAFCLASSSCYIVNDLVDVERDRRHPEKRRRPIASGRVSRGAARVMATVLTAGALVLACWIDLNFGMAVLIYIAFTHFYSFAGKNIAVLEIVLVAVGFVLRAVGGALAIEVPYSDWFVLCTFFVALFIAVSKRTAEYRTAGVQSETRPVLVAYGEGALRAFTITAMAAAVISYSLWVQDQLAETGDGARLLLITVPFVVVAIFRYHLLVERGEAGEKPEETLLTDRSLQLSILGFLLVALAAFYGR